MHIISTNPKGRHLDIFFDFLGGGIPTRWITTFRSFVFSDTTSRFCPHKKWEIPEWKWHRGEIFRSKTGVSKWNMMRHLLTTPLKFNIQTQNAAIYERKYIFQFIMIWYLFVKCLWVKDIRIFLSEKNHHCRENMGYSRTWIIISNPYCVGIRHF